MEILDTFIPDLKRSLIVIINPADPIMPARNTGMRGKR
jgi:hypothetical protein